MLANDDDDKDKYEPITQTENSGGGRRNRPTRVGASTPDDSSKKKIHPPAIKPRVLARYRKPQNASQNSEETSAASHTIEFKIGEGCQLTVKELAEQLKTTDTEVIKTLFLRGYPRTVNQVVELELAIQCALDFGYSVNHHGDSQ